MNAPVSPATVPHSIKLRIADFLLLDSSGAFDDYGKTELIEGEVIGMNAQFSRHSRVKTMFVRRLAEWAEKSALNLEALSEVSVQLSETSMPEPDIVLTSYHGDEFVPVDTVQLIIEIADTTLEIDMGRKLRIYAEAGVPEYWVVNLNGGQVMQMWEPSGDGYAQRDVVAFGDNVASQMIVGLSVPTER